MGYFEGFKKYEILQKRLEIKKKKIDRFSLFPFSFFAFSKYIGIKRKRLKRMIDTIYKLCQRVIL